MYRIIDDLKSSKMVDKKISAIAGFLFCVMVLVLLLILYYPVPSSDDDDDEWSTINIKHWNNEFSEPTPQPESKIAEVAKVIEDMGATFLALLAVICVSVGLAFLICACCCCA